MQNINTHHWNQQQQQQQRHEQQHFNKEGVCARKGESKRNTNTIHELDFKRNVSRK